MNVDLVFSWKKQEYNPKKENERFFLNTTEPILKIQKKKV